MGKVKNTDCNGCAGSLVVEIQQSLNHKHSNIVAAVVSKKP